jgi:hypothetical protein
MAGHHGFGQRVVGGLVRQVFLAREEANEGPTPLGGRIAERPAQHGVCSLESIEEQPLCRRILDAELDLASGSGQGAEVVGQNDPYHDRVWTSTERTRGRSRTIDCQLSPSSGEA